MRHQSFLPFAGLALLGCSAAAQQAAAQPAATPAQQAAQIEQMQRQIDALQAQLNALKQQMQASAGAPATAVAPAVASTTTSSPGNATTPAAEAHSVTAEAAQARLPEAFQGTTFNIGIDGYYGYNFNAPVGRVNLLRAYDVTSNSFNLNQASVVIERLPTAESRLGGRLDLQFGQATETLQGSSSNEQRPQVWRNLFQVYGSYLAPVGSGLQLDFGKFASALGNEGNYTKDQIAYSRAYSFNYLPFYHMGLRAAYNLTPRVNLTYWLVNGANDTEDLNGFKSQAFLFTLKPAKTLTWNVNYYFGQEARDVQPNLNPQPPSLPTQPGLPTANITPAPNGREHIFDTYATWNPGARWTVIGEGDYVLNRTVQQQRPARVALGSLTSRFALTPSANVGARFEYLDDRGGLFSTRTQALKEFTLVADRTLTPGFVARAEYRRDWSNQQFFLSDTANALKHAQTTATLGLIYWWGTKQGAW